MRPSADGPISPALSHQPVVRLGLLSTSEGSVTIDRGRLPWAIVLVWTACSTFALVAIYLYFFTDSTVGAGADAHAYWLAGQTDDPYAAEPGAKDAYLYSPAFRQLITPLALLPFPVFYGLWIVLMGACYAWLLAPLGWRWGLPLWVACIPELAIGNVVALLCVALVLGVAGRGQTWAFPALTKITLGVVGGVWHLARGEWLPLVRFLGAVGAVFAVSYSMTPDQWGAWVAFLLEQDGYDDVLMRSAAAVAITALAARADKPWLLAFMFLLATPVVSGSNLLATLAAVPRLLGTRADREPARDRVRAVAAVTEVRPRPRHGS